MHDQIMDNLDTLGGHGTIGLWCQCTQFGKEQRLLEGEVNTMSHKQ